MEDYVKLFRDITGTSLTKKDADYRSGDEIDEHIFEAVSRLFFEDREAFYYLKQEIEKAVTKDKNRLFLSTAGYFYYVDCDFKKAIQYFQKSIESNPQELEAWFCLAFCYRQTGEENKFNAIILHYDSIIKEFISKKKGPDRAGCLRNYLNC